MKNVFNRKIWYNGAVKIHGEPPSIPSIKSYNYLKSENYFVKPKLHRNPMSEKLDMYE